MNLMPSVSVRGDVFFYEDIQACINAVVFICYAKKREFIEHSWLEIKHSRLIKRLANSVSQIQ
jgi:hypothetical protein